MNKAQFTVEQKIKLWEKCFDYFTETYPDIRTELEYSSPWELLVAVILSAQCTDAKVNEVTKKLFIKYPTICSVADASYNELCEAIFSTGFYKNKAKYLHSCAQIILTQHNGKVPSTMEEILLLPGVGRKTANVVLGNLYGSAEGIAVDTHVRRFALRFGFSTSENPTTIERDLRAVIPKEQYNSGAYYIKQYGRSIGKAEGRGYKYNLDNLWNMYQEFLTRISNS